MDNGAVLARLTISQELALGDTLLVRAQGSTLEAWRHDGSAWARLGTVVDSIYPAAGYVGVGPAARKDRSTRRLRDADRQLTTTEPG